MRAAKPHSELHAELHAEPEEKSNKSLPTLLEQVKESNRSNVLFSEIRKYLANPKDHDKPNVYLRGSRAANELLYKDDKLWVTDDLCLDVIQEVHN